MILINLFYTLGMKFIKCIQNFPLSCPRKSWVTSFRKRIELWFFENSKSITIFVLKLISATQNSLGCCWKKIFHFCSQLFRRYCHLKMKELPLGQKLLLIFWLPGWAEWCHCFHLDTGAGQPSGPREPSAGLPPWSAEPGLLSPCLSLALCSEHCEGSLECPGLEHGELTRSHFSVWAPKFDCCVRGYSS